MLSTHDLGSAYERRPIAGLIDTRSRTADRSDRLCDRARRQRRARVPVLVMMHGTTGVSDPCAPSRNLDDDESDNFGLAMVLSLIASNGYIVVAPDYIGLKASGTPSTEAHPYLVGEVAANGAWNSVRASDERLDSLRHASHAPTPFRLSSSRANSTHSSIRRSSDRLSTTAAPLVNTPTGATSSVRARTTARVSLGHRRCARLHRRTYRRRDSCRRLRHDSADAVQ